MSTSDGLIVSLTQLLANDIYRKTIVPRSNITTEKAEKVELMISRYGTFVVIGAAIWMAWTPPQYLAVYLWIGIGAIVSATAGPLVIGTLWKRATKSAAIISMLVGTSTYWIVYLGVGLDNPFAAAGIGVLVSLTLMFVLSLVTPKPAQHEIDRVFNPGKTESL